MAAGDVLHAYGAAAALDFDTAGATLKNLANLAVGWSAPVTDASPCPDRVMVHASIKVHSSAPTAGGSIEFYLLRADDHATEIRDGDTITSTDHGTNATAAVVARLRQNLGLVGLIIVDATADVVYQKSFVINDPGTDWVLLVYNGTGQVLANEDSVHVVHYRSIMPQIAQS